MPHDTTQPDQNLLRRLRQLKRLLDGGKPVQDLFNRTLTRLKTSPTAVFENEINTEGITGASDSSTEFNIMTS